MPNPLGRTIECEFHYSFPIPPLFFQSFGSLPEVIRMNMAKFVVHLTPAFCVPLNDSDKLAVRHSGFFIRAAYMMLKLLAGLKQKAGGHVIQAEDDRAKVMASLDTICTKCGHAILPGDLRRIDTFLIECRDRFDVSERKPRR
jgi:hypothetical protein